MLLVILYCASPSWYILQFNYFVLINVLGDSILCRSIFVLAIYSVNLQRVDSGLFGRNTEENLLSLAPYIVAVPLLEIRTTSIPQVYSIISEPHYSVGILGVFADKALITYGLTMAGQGQ